MAELREWRTNPCPECGTKQLNTFEPPDAGPGRVLLCPKCEYAMQVEEERKCGRCGDPESEHQLRHNKNHFFERVNQMSLELAIPVDSRSLIKIQVTPDLKVGLRFKHSFSEAYVRGVKKHTKLTYCAVYELDGNDIPRAKISFGIAKCSEQDNFSREVGRKLSLRRALLEDKHFSYEERETIWKGYFNRIPVIKDEGNPPEQRQDVVEGIVVKSEIVDNKQQPLLCEENIDPGDEISSPVNVSNLVH